MGACAAPPPPRHAAPAPPNAAVARRGDRSRHRPGRSRASIVPPENRARDVHRHPIETLLFFGIKPDMTVVEVWPGAGGWYTEVLAPLLAERGRLYAAQPAAAPGNAFITGNLKAFADKLAAQPAIYGKVEVTTLDHGSDAIAPPGSADMVVTFRNLHNWMSLGTGAGGVRRDAPGAEAWRHARRRRASRRPGEAAGSARHQRLRQRGIRDRADRRPRASSWWRDPRSTRTRKTPRTTSRACGRCRPTIGSASAIARSTQRSARAIASR